MVDVRGVSKSFGETLVVKDVTLQLQKGGLTSIIGPNGAGKSTLLSMVARLLPADLGTITIDGLDVSKTPGDILARRLSILRQDNHTSTRLTVGDLVAFGRYPYSKGASTAKDREHVERALSYFDLVHLRDRFLDELSGGQRQRAHVAMVLCQDTSYMLFDEPLNNLDIPHAVSMMKLLQKAVHDFNKTAIVVLHDINFASCYSDHIVVMRDGRVMLQGSPREIIHPATLKEIFECNFEVHQIGTDQIAVYYT